MNDFKQFEEPDYTTDMLSDGVRYVLPRRQLGRVRHIGCIAVVFGIVEIGFLIAFASLMVFVSLDELANLDAGRWVVIVLACIGFLIFVIQGLIVLRCGIAVIRNRTRCEIEVRGGMIRVRERFLFFMPRRARVVSKIQRLRIVTANEATSGKQGFDMRVWLGDFDTALMADSIAGRKFPIAAAYPRELLVRLAEELAPQLEAELSIASATIDRDATAVDVGERVLRKIEVVEGSVDPSEADKLPAVPVQPVGSTATIERREYGITITIPPAGLWKGSKGLFVFSLFWNAFIGIFIVVGTLGATGVIKMEGNGPPWMMLVGILPFVAVGVGLTIASVNMGRRHATIATADDLVMIVRHSIFGKSTREWSANQISAICIGNSGMEVNDVPVQELQIHPNDGKKFGCLSQLDDDELVWIADELNQALAIRRSSDPAAP